MAAGQIRVEKTGRQVIDRLGKRKNVWVDVGMVHETEHWLSNNQRPPLAAFREKEDTMHAYHMNT